jgi:hypothetical protein
MRLRLKGRDYLPADVFHESGLFTKGAVFLDSQDRNAAAAEICHQNVVAGLVDGEVTRARPSRRQRVQQMQLAGFGIN